MRFFVAGRPVPWSVSRRGTKQPRLVSYQDRIKLAAYQADVPRFAAVELRFLFLFKRPRKAKLWFPGRRTGDVTNFVKAAEDALAKMVTSDDSHTVYVSGYKRYTRTGEAEGTHIRVSEAKEGTDGSDA